MNASFSHQICFSAEIVLRDTECGGIRNPFPAPVASFRFVVVGRDMGAIIVGPEALAPGHKYSVEMIFWDPAVADLAGSGNVAFQIHYAGRVIGEGKLLALQYRGPVPSWNLNPVETQANAAQQ